MFNKKDLFFIQISCVLVINVRLDSHRLLLHTYNSLLYHETNTYVLFGRIIQYKHSDFN